MSIRTMVVLIANICMTSNIRGCNSLDHADHVQTHRFVFEIPNGLFVLITYGVSAAALSVLTSLGVAALYVLMTLGVAAAALSVLTTLGVASAALPVLATLGVAALSVHTTLGVAAIAYIGSLLSALRR